ncbi:MAG: alanine racemase C-terminal domain-containing protein, partial [Oscillospiraceae bacterium]
RAGIIMYGISPSEQMSDLGFLPVMSIKSVVSMVKTIKAGTAVSYGRNFVAKTDMKVATVPIGYADGYSRLLSNKGKMIVNGTLVSIIGNVCMDQVMLDVSEVNGVKQGDIVTILGSDGGLIITADDIAREIGTIGYEIVCVVGRRVPRIYIKNSKTVEVVDYILDSPTV